MCLKCGSVIREGRKGGVRDFYITGDLNVELGLMSRDEKVFEELTEMYGPLARTRQGSRRLQEIDVI